jgi:diguanylate cyclase (GGDEF)-like protein/PAS domain S-box-containing protein
MKAVFLALMFCMLAASGMAAPVGPPAPPVTPSHQVDFAASDAVIPLRAALTPYHAPGGTEKDGSLWYILALTNDQVRPVSRVILAGQPPSMALSILPRSSRPQILAVASSDSGVVVEPAPDYGHRAWRVIIPPVTQVGLALQVLNTQTPPALFAWTEPALAGHNRSLAIFITAVGAFIGAAALITGGLAVMIRHAAPRWVALTLALLLWSWLAGTGMFDASLATHIGGPFGLTAFLTALALAAGARLADAIIPMRETWPRHEKNFRYALYALCGLGGLAWLGVPAATLLTDIAIVAGSTGVAAYLFVWGRRGLKAAQVILPSAAAFALVALAAALTSLTNFFGGGLGESLTGPAATGGFAAAGAILLALAVIASEENAVLPFLHGSAAAKLLEAQGDDAVVDETTPFANLALAAIGSAHQGVFALDLRAELVTLSPEATAMLGLGAHETNLSEADWLTMVHPDDRGVFRQAFSQARPGQKLRLEFRAIRNGATRWLELNAGVHRLDGAADLLGLLADVTARKEDESRKTPAASADALTGLGNRVALMAALETFQDGPSFPDGLLALLDLDRFKSIHASLGDAGGDLVLRGTAERLTERFGKEAQIFRVGGDAFALLFARPSLKPDALGEALVGLCGPSHPYEGRDIYAPASAGIAPAAEDPLVLIANAELALGAAKRQGGACARIYDPALKADAPQDAVALEADLRRALERGEIAVFYQPIMHLEGRALAGFEALLRWHHPERGLIEPGDFIAHSEESGLIVALGRFALEQAAGDLSHWQHYFPLQPPLFVSVNLSRRQLQGGGFEELFGQVLKQSQVAPGTLKLEITESAVGSGAELGGMLGRLKAMGAGLAIDDFGTGASTLSRVRNLPFDTIKMDKSFLARHAGSALGNDSAVILSSVVAMAHELGRSVVVEGVESESDAAWLNSLGCAFGQGYYFSLPLAPAEALAFIARHYDVAAASS